MGHFFWGTLYLSFGIFGRIGEKGKATYYFFILEFPKWIYHFAERLTVALKHEGLENLQNQQ